MAHYVYLHFLKPDIYHTIHILFPYKNITIALCILRSPADSDAFQSGRYADHNGRPESLVIMD